MGNKLAAGMVETSNGTAIDLRNICSPIVVFCSKGDNITPPQQALGWILDLYDDVDEIRSYGQTIVYTVHDTVGHLGIFVSGGVAKKEHREFSSNIDLIDVLPPGLYEATFERKSGESINPDLVSGDWIMRCEQRTLDDIRAMGGNNAADERRFATAARVSEINLALYRTFAQPFVKALFPPAAAERVRQFHPLRLQYELFNDAAPFAAPLAQMAERARDNRRPASPDNPFIKAEGAMSEQIVKTLDAWRDLQEGISESIFMTIYGSPALQAAVGIDPASSQPPRKAAKSSLHRELVAARIAELKSQIETGGLQECVVRGLLYVGLSRGRVDERGAEALRTIRLMEDRPQLTVAQFKAMARTQFLLLLIDPEQTLAAIPKLLPTGSEDRQKGLAAIRKVLRASGEISGEAAERMKRVESLFEAEDAGRAGARGIALAPDVERAKASYTPQCNCRESSHERRSDGYPRAAPCEI